MLSLYSIEQVDPRADTRLQLVAIRAADDELPGWWLIQERIAEVHQLLEEHDQAIAIYE